MSSINDNAPVRKPSARYHHPERAALVARMHPDLRQLTLPHTKVSDRARIAQLLRAAKDRIAWGDYRAANDIVTQALELLP